MWWLYFFKNKKSVCLCAAHFNCCRENSNQNYGYLHTFNQDNNEISETVCVQSCVKLKSADKVYINYIAKSIRLFAFPQVLGVCWRISDHSFRSARSDTGVG